MSPVSLGLSIPQCIPLASACPIEKVTPWVDFVYLTSGSETDKGIQNSSALTENPLSEAQYVSRCYRFRQMQFLLTEIIWLWLLLLVFPLCIIYFIIFIGGLFQIYITTKSIPNLALTTFMMVITQLNKLQYTKSAGEFYHTFFFWQTC